MATKNRSRTVEADSMGDNDQKPTLVQILANLLICQYCCRQVAPPLFQYSGLSYYICDMCVEKMKECSDCPLPEMRKRDLLIEQVGFDTILKCSYSAAGCTFTGKTVFTVAKHEECCRFISNTDVRSGQESKTIELSSDVVTSEGCTIDEDPPGQLLEEAILIGMDCPVCFTRIPLPIRECENGHRMCKKCFNRLEQCPVCRGPKSSEPSYFLQFIYPMIRVFCKNVDNGCKVRDNVPSIIRHEEYCKFHLEACPLIGINCGWQGLRSGILDHCKSCHGEEFSLEPQCSGVFVYKDDYSYKFIYAYDIFFRYGWKKTDKGFYLSINYLGEKRSSRYFYAVDMTCENRSYRTRLAGTYECNPRSRDAPQEYIYWRKRWQQNNPFDDCSVKFSLRIMQSDQALHLQPILFEFGSL